MQNLVMKFSLNFHQFSCADPWDFWAEVFAEFFFCSECPSKITGWLRNRTGTGNRNRRNRFSRNRNRNRNRRKPFSRNRNRKWNRSFLLNSTETQKNPFCRGTARTENPEQLEPFPSQTVTEPNRTGASQQNQPESPLKHKLRPKLHSATTLGE